ncbi:carboxylesterase family protein [bacterium]|nr:carboxylesterase family protein [bacterium]
MQYRKVISSIFLFLWLVSCLIDAGQNLRSPSVTVDTGPIIGVIKGKSVMFLGIPYASPPVGDLRWRSPQIMPSWKEPLDATQPGAHCPQTRHQDASNEDCLTINVYTPSLKSEEPLPVLFWIHGGGYRTGTGAYYSSRNMNNPAELVDAKLWNRQGVILVTLNYRLGALGFFAHDALDGSQGVNYGLLDIVAGLKWVNRNIDTFGGDKSRLTIIGSSAGGNAVQSLMVMPQAEALFSAAISQSGYGTTVLPRTRHVESLTRSPSAENISKAILERAIEPSSDPLLAEDLRALTANQLVNANDGLHYPIVDGITLLEEPGILFRQGKQHSVPYMSGGSTYDGSSYKAEMGLSPDTLLASTEPYADAVRVLYEIEKATYAPEVKQLFGDLRYVLPSRYTTQQMNRVNQPGYLYMLSYIPPSEREHWRGAPHSWQKRPLFRDKGIPIINNMRQYMVNLVKTGNPNSIGLPDWPSVAAGKVPWMMFGDEPKVKLDVWQEKLDLLQSVYEHRIHPLVPK